jgi:hypothetical protein
MEPHRLNYNSLVFFHYHVFMVSIPEDYFYIDQHFLYVLGALKSPWAF